MNADAARFARELIAEPTLPIDAKAEVSRAPSWPQRPATQAFYGLAGKFVRTLEPHSEADPLALLVQVLTAFGNLIGRGPHWRVEADRHSLNLFVVLLGATSKGRKGTSEGRVRAALRLCDQEWAASRILSGLSSGEGLIWAVRDPITKHEAIRERGRVVGYQDVEVDAGVLDKRLLVFEAEFASVLRQLERDGNTLSPIIRQAWDSGNLRTMTKNSPASATGAHISVIGHITIEELRRYLSATEQGNGFGNRFLWLCVRRSKFLPEDEDRCVSECELAPLIAAFKAAADFSRTVGEMRRDQTAGAYWRATYRDLTSGRPGLLGAITSRAEAQVMRLACLYALLDLSNIVRGEHLEAALALWEYAEKSCEHVFGDATGDPEADVILKALRSSPAGLSRTEINSLFGHNKPSGMISRALESLAALGLANPETRQTAGRSSEIWTAA